MLLEPCGEALGGSIRKEVYDVVRIDTAHAVFRPRNMSPEELEQGYAWMYQRLFSHASIWRRRPEDWRALAPYLPMSYLYKRSNRFWRLLIEHHLVHAAWRPWSN
jgi:hypothetical protein